MPSNPLFLNEPLEAISYTTLPGIFWGVNLSLYFLCTQIFYCRYNQNPDERKKLVLQFIYNSVMVLMVGRQLSGGTRLEQLGYIDHGGVHDEPGVFLASLPPVSAVGLTVALSDFVVPGMNYLVQLWRIWVIWGVSPYKLVLTSFLLLLVIAAEALNVFTFLLIEHDAQRRMRLFDILATIQIAAGLMFTLLVTLLLVGRILVMQWRFNHIIGISENSKQYTSIIAMLVESYALDAVWQTGTVISIALTSAGKPEESYYIFSNTGDQVTVFAFLLVSYRVLSKRAWTPETGTRVSSLRWNHEDPETVRTTGQTTSLVDD